MHATIIYSISYASIVGIIFLWRISQLLTLQLKERLFAVLTKWALHTLILRRQKGSSSVNVLAAILIALFCVGNVIGCVIAVHSRADFSLRLARLCVVNLVLLFLGGRANLIVDRLLRWPMTEHNLVHRWVGRVSVMEAIAHSVLRVMEGRSSMTRFEIALIAITSTIGGTSFYLVRRRLYEVFLASHFLGSMALLTMLWLHIGIRKTYALVCLSVATTLLLSQKIMWICLLLYRNTGSGPHSRATIIRSGQSIGDEEVLQIQVVLKRPWHIRPGQYIYLSLPHFGFFGSGFLESHPYMISWFATDEKTSTKTITLLVRCARGFSGRLRLASSPSYAIVDGPYGGGALETLDAYDTVLFMANGIGIASHLLAIRHLLVAHDEQTARIRRLTLIWFLETNDQLRWAEDFLLALHDMDKSNILLIYILKPNASAGSAESERTTLYQPRKRIYPLFSNLDMDWWIDQEWRAEAGNMLVVVCGSPLFELRARRAVCRSNHRIAFVNSEYQPDETLASGLSSVRYNS